MAWLMWTALAASAPPAGGAAPAGVGPMGLAAALFALAALTDLFDGMAARAFNAQSKFGRIIDPIADKALVGLPLIVMAAHQWLSGGDLALPIALAAAVIVARDVAMTWIRLASPDGEGVRVSSLAKIKTALELFVVGALLVLLAIREQVGLGEGARATVEALSLLQAGWTFLLVITAALSAYTAFQYLRAKG